MLGWTAQIRRRIGRRRGVVLCTLLIALAVLVRGLSLLQNDLNTRQAAALADDRPRYLYRSSFRNDPDHVFEEQVSHALEEIERQQPAQHGAKESAHTIWQIMLGSQDNGSPTRGDDSLKFEEVNSEWKYKLVTTEWAEEFVTITLASIPGLARLYHSYPHHVLRADLLRYLILWYYGGYYADTDVFPAKSINNCPSLQQSVFQTDTPDVSLVVGIEIDEPFASAQKMHDWHWVRSYGFIQYTLYAPRRFSPLLRQIIVRVLSHTKRHIDRSSFFLGARYNELTTLEITGPGVFTDTILDVLSNTLPGDHPLILQSLEADEGLGDLIPPSSVIPQKRVTWAPFHRITSPVCVNGSEAKSGSDLGGLCVLPVNAWGNGQRHSGAENFLSAHACINHRFGGTWKPWKKSWKKYLFGK
ncbi:Alpha-1,6-mannosyltransferase [Penicillium ucsense]|uniref:Alpha-1,6-mannosyltransferase n=1 Tax=Penicillium ucsense TaxID=2839758 RepID=A0A8J8WNC6_9EURO|nr:Alpha-1,6-mannosyltransferase [Penicillium ucsense]KAF7734883.1 Alpha-1,6-mannosyltransferase [Penicillium ucsense]